MKAFKKEMIKLLVERTGRGALFSKVKWVDGNPNIAALKDFGYTDKEIKEISIEYPDIYDDEIQGYNANDTLYIKFLGHIPGSKCLSFYRYKTLMRHLLHEAAHKYTDMRYHNSNLSDMEPHGVEFQESCILLGLNPHYEASETETNFRIEYSEDDMILASLTYKWFDMCAIKHIIEATGELPPDNDLPNWFKEELVQKNKGM